MSLGGVVLMSKLQKEVLGFQIWWLLNNIVIIKSVTAELAE